MVTGSWPVDTVRGKCLAEIWDEETQRQYQGQQPDTMERCQLPGATEAEESRVGVILLMALEPTSSFPTPTQVPC